MITLDSIDRDKFVDEIKKIDIKDEIIFELNDGFAMNFEIVLHYIDLKKVKKITINKVREVDMICYRKYLSILQQFYYYYSKKFEIIFDNLNNEELIATLAEKNYFLYCKNNNLEANWLKPQLARELNKIEKYKKLKKYREFEIISKKIGEFPFSSFNFPTENGVDRLVFYIYDYDEQSREKIIELLKQIGVDKKEVYDLINSNKFFDIYEYYGIGFNYKAGELLRFTFYTKFSSLIKNNFGVEKFLEQKHNIKVPLLKNALYYGIDYYKDYCEIKVYEGSILFREELDDKELENVLRNKKTEKVLKYRDENKVNEKFEFNLFETFNKDEIEVLKKNDLYKQDNKIVAIYIKDKKVVKKVFYEI